MKQNKKWIPIFIAPAVILFLMVYIVPLGMVIYSSLFEYRLIPTKLEIVHNFIGLQNFFSLFTDKGFMTAFTNTLKWILIHCTIHVFLGVLLAFILYKKPHGWKFVRVVYMIPNIISQAAIGMIFVNMYNPSYGMLNTFLGAVGLERLQQNWLFSPKTAFGAVTMTWVLYAGYTTTMVLAQALSVDSSLVEAAQVDGANELQTDIYIMLPMVKRMIGTTVTMAASYMLQMFSLIYITTAGGPGKMTTNLPLLLYQTSMKSNNYGYANAMGVIIIILGFICMGIINRIFRMNDDAY